MTNLVEHLEFRPGDSVDEYVLLEPIGVGGEAALWSALDIHNKHVVVMKFVRKHDKPDEVASFATFNRLLELNHSNIRRMHKVGEKGKFNFLCMQYYPYGSLKELLNKGVLDPKGIIRLGAQIASALDYIHGLNIVHRDLKPTNILVDVKKRVYLTDFGLAKPLSQTTQAIHTGHGTAPYSPPEQHTKAQLSQTSDIYSFGVMLFEMFTGMLPWRGQAALAIKQIDTGEQLPDPRAYRPDLPVGLGGALRALTDAESGRRPATASKALRLVVAAFGGDMEDFTGHIDEFDMVAKVMQTVPPVVDLDIWMEDEAKHLLDRSMIWSNVERSETSLSLTQFAFLDSILAKEIQNGDLLSSTRLQFMAREAMTHGVNQYFWWQTLKDPDTRLGIFETLIESGDEEGINRALSLALEGLPTSDLLGTPSLPISSRLIDLALIPADNELRYKALAFLSRGVQPSYVWQNLQFSPAEDAKLATLAVTEDHKLARVAAQLIGLIRSEAAVQAIWQSGERGSPERVMAALRVVRETAGSLPPSLPESAKARVWLELAFEQLFSRRPGLLQSYATSALAGALALGIHVYATLRVPSLFTTGRILPALGNAILIGPMIGLGIFLTRLLVIRFRILSLRVRMAVGILAGTLVVNTSFVAQHALFLDRFISGPWVLIGSFFIILGFGLGAGLLSSKFLRVILSATSSGLGIGLSWWFAQINGQSPMLYYELDQSGRSTLLVVITALILGILPNLRSDLLQGDDTRDSLGRTQYE